MAWLAHSKLGLVIMALLVGGGAGLGAAGFRELIFLFTWIFTGHRRFGQQGHAASLHLPFAGFYFVLFVPIIGGLLYGPLIQRFAREARGHGVPEVMLAVAENGGRIRPPVTIVKAFASAICIGTGGSVGREGPIVQIGSAFASSLGQLVRMTETRLRVIVACGAAGGIAATFNAPLTGLFFGFEIVLREFSLDALLATSLSAVAADLISRALFGGGPFFAAIPHDLTVGNDSTYLLVALLGLVAGLIGYGFKMFLYGMEDRVDQLWGSRPEWLRPAVGGVALGLLLLALPQMYGVGYPVMDQVLAGHEVLWFVLILMLGKVAASSLTLSIGGAGGVFAPSLFTGAAAGEAFGIVVHHLFGPATGPPAMYGVLAMGGVFAGAAQAPLTSIASVAEMTGNFTLMLPIMLVTGIASALSRRLTYGSIYTTKLLRRGIDIERPRATAALQSILVSDVMTPLSDLDGHAGLGKTDEAAEAVPTVVDAVESLVGPVRGSRRTQVLFADEDLAQALRQLVLFGRDGLPVLSQDSELTGWLTRNNVLQALAEEVSSSTASIQQGARAVDPGYDEVSPGSAQSPQPGTPLVGYELLELEVKVGSPAADRRVQDVLWPPATVPVAITKRGEIRAVRPETILTSGERVTVLVPSG
jgi:CIC family chloride channel protein